MPRIDARLKFFRGNRAFAAANALYLLVSQDGAVADLVLFHFLDGFVGFGHGEGLGLCHDAVAGSYVEHLAQLVGPADGAAADGALAGDEREGLEGDRRGRNSDKTERSGGAKDLEVHAPILVSIGGVEDKVQGAGDFFHGLCFATVDEVVSAEGTSFFFLVGGGGEGGDFSAEGRANWMARWPSPPMPMTATREDGFTPWMRKGL